MMHPPTGALAFQPYGTDGTRAINSVARAELNVMLLDGGRASPGVAHRTSTTAAPASTSRRAS